MWCQCLQRRCRSTDAVEKRYGTNSLRNWFNSAKKNEMCLHNLGGVRIGRTRVWSTQLLARLQNVRKGKLNRWSTNERPKIAPVSWANHHESAKEWYVNKKMIAVNNAPSVALVAQEQNVWSPHFCGVSYVQSESNLPQKKMPIPFQRLVSSSFSFR